jgi:hypothetical protein
MSLAGITQHCKIMYSEWPGPGWVQQAMIMVISVSLRKPGAVGLGFSQSHLGESMTGNAYHRQEIQGWQPHCYLKGPDSCTTGISQAESC